MTRHGLRLEAGSALPNIAFPPRLPRRAANPHSHRNLLRGRNFSIDEPVAGLVEPGQPRSAAAATGRASSFGIDPRSMTGRSAVAPDFPRDLDDERELGPLLVLGEEVAFLGR